VVRLLSMVLVLGLGGASFAHAEAANTVAVQRLSVASVNTYKGAIEAINNTAIAAQVQGVVRHIYVNAGDTVKAGDKLLAIDANQAQQQQQALQAQAAATEAKLQALTNELQRQRTLHQQKYLSQGAIERTEAEHKALQAQLAAQRAQLATAKSQTGFFTLRAPYDGTIIDVPATTGLLAMPGTPLLSLFKPNALRAAVSVPVAALPQPLTKEQVVVTLGQRQLNVASVQPLPTIHTSSHTVRVRINLAENDVALFPGQHVTVQLAGNQATQRLYIPTQAVVQRAELTAVYVLNQQQKPILRQVRLGPVSGDKVEVLSGLAEGETVFLSTPTLKE